MTGWRTILQKNAHDAGEQVDRDEGAAEHRFRVDVAVAKHIKYAVGAAQSMGQ